MTLPSGHPGAPPPKPRPGSVTAAGIMTLLLSLVSLAWAVILTIGFLMASEELLRSQLRRTEPGVSGEQLDTMVSLTRGLGYATAALIAILGIALAVLAVPVIRGSRVARILTWVATGVHVLCGLGAVVSAASGIRGNGFVVAVPLLTLISAVSVIILLTLPASNRYFARPLAPWQAPTGFGPATPAAAPPPVDQETTQDTTTEKSPAASPAHPEQH